MSRSTSAPLLPRFLPVAAAVVHPSSPTFASSSLSSSFYPLSPTAVLRSPISPSSSGGWRGKFVVAIAVLSLVAFILIVVAYRNQLFHLLDQFAHYVRSSPVLGTLLCIALLATTAFPPMMGYSTVLYLCGYIYGFPWGWIPSFIGALSGSVLCFYLSRYYLRDWAQRKLSAYATAKALKRTIEKRGLRLMILIRLAPYPFNFCNVLLATTNVSLRDFTVATAISLPKTLLHTYIGASISSFADMSKGHGQAHTGQLLILGLSILLGLALTAWLWIHVQRIVNEDNHWDDDDVMDIEREGRASGTLMRMRSGSASQGSINLRHVVVDGGAGATSLSTGNHGTSGGGPATVGVGGMTLQDHRPCSTSSTLDAPAPPFSLLPGHLLFKADEAEDPLMPPTNEERVPLGETETSARGASSVASVQ